MATPVFQHEDCEIEPVDPIVTDNMLIDPSVPDPPDPIPDCLNTTPLPLSPPIPQLDPDEFCAEFEVATATVTYDEVPTPDLDFTFTKQPSGCAFTVDFDMRLPNAELDCPIITIDGSDAGGSITIDDMASGATIDFSVDKHPTLCELDFGLDIVIPNFCPTVSTGGSITVNPLALVPTLDFSVSRTSVGTTCDFDLNIDIELPDFCPSLAAGSSTIEFGESATPSLSFNIQSVGDCDFEFDIQVDLPDFCPTFDTTNSSIMLDENISEPTISFDIERNEGGAPGEFNCEFDVTMEIRLPAKRVDVIDYVDCFDGMFAVYSKQVLVLKDLFDHPPSYLACCCTDTGTATVTTTETITETATETDTRTATTTGTGTATQTATSTGTGGDDIVGCKCCPDGVPRFYMVNNVAGFVNNSECDECNFLNGGPFILEYVEGSSPQCRWEGNIGEMCDLPVKLVLSMPEGDCVGTAWGLDWFFPGDVGIGSISGPVGGPWQCFGCNHFTSFTGSAFCIGIFASADVCAI